MLQHLQPEVITDRNLSIIVSQTYYITDFFYHIFFLYPK